MSGKFLPELIALPRLGRCCLVNIKRFLLHNYSLEKLDLMRNFKLGGSLPNGIGRLNHLKLFRLFDNGVTGTIPEDLFKIDALEILTIHSTMVCRLCTLMYYSIGKCDNEFFSN